MSTFCQLFQPVCIDFDQPVPNSDSSIVRHTSLVTLHNGRVFCPKAVKWWLENMIFHSSKKREFHLKFELNRSATEFFTLGLLKLKFKMHHCAKIKCQNQVFLSHNSHYFLEFSIKFYSFNHS